MKLADNLKRYREKNDMTQEAVALEVRISRQSVSKWENGESYPSIDNLIILSRLFNTSIDELIMGEKFLQLPHTVGRTADNYLLKRSLLTSGFLGLVVFQALNSWLWGFGVFVLAMVFVIFCFYAPLIDLIYQHWILDKTLISYLLPTTNYWEKLKRTLAILRKQQPPHLATLNYEAIDGIELIYEKKPHDLTTTNLSLYTYNLTPFFMISNRDPFYFMITTEDGSTIKLDLTVVIYYQNTGYHYLTELVTFFESKGLAVSDPFDIIPIQQGGYRLYDYMYHGKQNKKTDS